MDHPIQEGISHGFIGEQVGLCQLIEEAKGHTLDAGDL